MALKNFSHFEGKAILYWNMKIGFCVVWVDCSNSFIHISLKSLPPENTAMPWKWALYPNQQRVDTSCWGRTIVFHLLSTKSPCLQKYFWLSSNETKTFTFIFQTFNSNLKEAKHCGLNYSLSPPGTTFLYTVNMYCSHWFDK